MLFRTTDDGHGRLIRQLVASAAQFYGRPPRTPDEMHAALTLYIREALGEPSIQSRPERVQFCQMLLRDLGTDRADFMLHVGDLLALVEPGEGDAPPVDDDDARLEELFNRAKAHGPGALTKMGERFTNRQVNAKFPLVTREHLSRMPYEGRTIAAIVGVKPPVENAPWLAVDFAFQPQNPVPGSARFFARIYPAFETPCGFSVDDRNAEWVDLTRQGLAFLDDDCRVLTVLTPSEDWSDTAALFGMLGRVYYRPKPTPQSTDRTEKGSR